MTSSSGLATAELLRHVCKAARQGDLLKLQDLMVRLNTIELPSSSSSSSCAAAAAAAAVCESALYFASKQGHVDVVRFLLQQQKQEQQQQENKNCKRCAREEGEDEGTSSDLSTTTATLATSTSRPTALFAATEEGHTEIVSLLLEHESEVSDCNDDSSHNDNNDINTPNAEGWTPLHVACWEGNVQLVQLLLTYNADVHVQTNQGRTPLHLAACYHHVAVAQLVVLRLRAMKKRKCTETTTHNTAILAHPDTTSTTAATTNKMHTVDAQDMNGSTALHLATDSTVYRSKPYYNSMIQLLLQHGADPNIQQRDGATPLHLATSTGNDIVARILLEQQPPLVTVDPLLKNQHGDIPLHMACRRNNTEHHALIQLLLLQNKSAALQVPDRQGWLPLHLACMHGATLDVVFSLLRKDPNGTVSRYRYTHS